MQIGLVPMPPSRLEKKQIKYSEYLKTKEANNETDIMKYDDWSFTDSYWTNNERFKFGITQKPLYGCGPKIKLHIQAILILQKVKLCLAGRIKVIGLL